MSITSKRKCSGFSLLELLIVVAIIGIFATLTTPMISHYLRDSHLKGATESLYHDLLHARSEAIKTQNDVKVVFQAGANWCYGFTTAASCNCLSANSCSLGQKNYQEFANTSLSMTGIGATTDFDGMRGLVSTTGTMVFTSSDGDKVSVKLNKLGQSSICSNDLGEYPSC